MHGLNHYSERKDVAPALQFLLWLDNQEHDLNLFVVAVNWLVSRLNYSFTCRLAEECNATFMCSCLHPAPTVGSRRWDLTSALMQPLEKIDFTYGLNDTEALCSTAAEVKKKKDHRRHRQ